ncbi:MAG TPA: MotA/TolQ/ExbB proton channel family protein [Thermoanaerobaculia bacterium]|nr:MotA/TolQ/ExbB proton channel family protein [Thermoanaerobaculia bacterium]
MTFLASLPAALFAQGLPTPEGPSIFETFWNSGPMAKAVFAVLVFFSLASWAIVVAKAVQLRRADRHSRRFLDTFHKSKRFSEVSAVATRLHASPMVGIFQAGYAEIDAQMKAAGVSPDGGAYRLRSLTSLERTLQRAIHVELSGLTRWTSFLATTAAAAPFIGLFGTVWGIMVAFGDIGLTGSTSLAVVAPGIAEALVNTAAGLAAAIPALVAYNYFAARLRRLRVRMEDFSLEFLSLAERNFT